MTGGARRPGASGLAAALALALAGVVGAAPAPAPGPRPDPGGGGGSPSSAARVQPSVVGLHAHVPADRPSAATLGVERAGSATLIGPDGLAVTVGYLVLEASRIDVTLADRRRTAARVVGHDFESGLALIRLDPAGSPLPAAPVGRSAPLAPGQPVAVVGRDGDAGAVGRAARVAAVGPFVAYWEYMLERALFVAPHHPSFGGAALVDAEGALVGVVSLRLATGHLAIPIDLLAPVREAIVRDGRPARAPRPWLGLRAVGVDDGIGVAGVSPAGPAHAAGLRAGDVILRLDGERVPDVEAFYRRLWARPVEAPRELAIRRDGTLRTLTVAPVDRYAVFGLRGP